MRTQQHRLVDAQAAACAANVQPGTIRVWLTRGKLTRHGYDSQGRALIDLDELRALQNLKTT